jgi:1-acyl-sn-glycerol-3-phosphate acyltransferase
VVFWLLAPATWLLTVAQPTPARAWAVCRGAARALFALAGMTPRLEGAQNLPAGACVLVCNHGSYLDGVILAAAFARPSVFVAKAELRQQRVAGPFLRRLGAVFVERFDLRQAVQDAEAMQALARRGDVLMVFPEGTFTAAPGLLPFRLGAFLAAEQAQVPVVPVILHGSRAALPGGSWLPRHARLEVNVLPPLPRPPPGDLFARAVRLRDAAYAAMAARLDRAEDAG